MEGMTLTQLAERAEVTPRTIRYYIQIGLLPAPGTSGPGAHYDAGYVDRIREIKRLQRAHLPLAEIRKRLVDEEDVGKREQAAPHAPAPAMAMREPSFAVREDDRMDRETPPPPPSRSQWDRIALGPDIELHVRRPLSRNTNRILEEIVQHAQDLLQEDQPGKA
jgi:DNA-binding transcriptional MerR regulator